MAVTHCEHHGRPALLLRAADGARALVTLHGAHVVSFIGAGSADELLYLSPTSSYADAAAIRGGVPVVFPQFSNRGPLMNHGFARTRDWQFLRSADGPDGAATLVLRLSDDAQGRAIWPHAFALELQVRVLGDTLEMELACTNTGSGALAFSCALHTYLRVDEVSQVCLQGLQGRGYWDKVDGRDKQQESALLSFAGETDRVYAGIAGELRLQRSADDKPPWLQISQKGFEDIVVWNPGADRCARLADMPPDGYRRMLCVEAAQITHPVTLQPEQRWAGTQTLQGSGSIAPSRLADDALRDSSRSRQP